MLTVHRNLLDIAMNILEKKSDLDHINVLADIFKINNTIAILEKFPYNASILQEAQDLDLKLQNKYPTISVFKMAVETFKVVVVPSPFGFTKSSNLPKEIDMLKLDKFGILADVLIKHNVISNVKYFIEKVEQYE